MADTFIYYLNRLLPGVSVKLFILCALFVALCTLPQYTFAATQPAVQLTEAEKKLIAEAERRSKIKTASIKSTYLPPKVGEMPQNSEIPMADAWEDPDWDTPLILSFYRNPYSFGNNLEQYLPCLTEALNGNPKAMLALSMLYYLWGYVIEEMYPDFPPQVHSAEYWQEWATRLTGPGWVNLRLGDLHRRWPAATRAFYKKAAELGNAEAMFQYYLLDSREEHYLYLSAALGYPRAAFVLSENIEKRGIAEEKDLANRYMWLSAINGDEWGLLRSSIAFYNNEFGVSSDSCERGYLYTLLSIRYNQGHPSLEQPENGCMLTPTQIAQLELEADNWQAALDQRKLPHILRLRLRREPLVTQMQQSLAPLMSTLNILPATAMAQATGSTEKTENTQNTVKAKNRFNWHLGFFVEDAEKTDFDNMHSNLPGYARQQFKEHNRRYLPFIYGFVIVTIPLSMGAVYLAHRRKKMRKLRRKVR